MSIRLAKFIADCGVASRRGAEDLIKSGHVIVDGKVPSTVPPLSTHLTSILI